MNRSAWMLEKKRAALANMDQLWSPVYDQNWDEVSPTHARFVSRLLELCPPGGLVLDAACGTGKYWPLVLASGRRIFGIDRSQGMLNAARAKFPGVPAERLALEELAHQAAFDAAMCIDDLESLFPEEWQPVLSGLWRAVRPGGHFYFTIETLPEAELEAAFAAAQQAGLPAVYGEWAPEGRYHYYPPIPRVESWLAQAGYTVLEQAASDDYVHFLLQK